MCRPLNSPPRCSCRSTFTSLPATVRTRWNWFCETLRASLYGNGNRRACSSTRIRLSRSSFSFMTWRLSCRRRGVTTWLYWRAEKRLGGSRCYWGRERCWMGSRSGAACPANAPARLNNTRPSSQLIDSPRKSGLHPYSGRLLILDGYGHRTTGQCT